MRTSTIFILCAVVLTVGCATLTPEERAGVRMTRDNNLVRECKWLAQVETSWEANYKRAEIQLMKKTFALGGNVVFISPQHPSFTTRLTGDAYKCASLPGQEATPPSPR